MIFVTIVGAALGAAFGSFACVIATRVPRKRSVVRPGSACDSCGTAIRACDNVPIVSWLVLRGRCRACAAPIPAFVLCFEAFGAIAGGLLAYAFLASVLSR